MNARKAQMILVQCVIASTTLAFAASLYRRNWIACLFEVACLVQSLTIRMLLQQLRLLDAVEAGR